MESLQVWLMVCRNCTGGAALSYLSTEGNKFNGIIPSNLGQLSGMYRLDLSSNSPEGDITEARFSQLTDLEHLDISYNSFNVIIPDNWLPPFDASFIDMSFCHTGTKFPTWIRTQTYLRSLQACGVGLAGKVPAWSSDMSTDGQSPSAQISEQAHENT
ncbi:LRR receptor-like serine threonine-protein kinase [Musa troglodytarum]|uniref:LRR receptor-like serine threonine-protein kinase n=1 Tax=Musa troglodytarum TaxID=320322 RepID=A0A9E7KRS5_9LILI|nr:LRR receptor-like serine threonine-protein kinase [Musa troglodytarum]